jgi:hypothetical protein
MTKLKKQLTDILGKSTAGKGLRREYDANSRDRPEASQLEPSKQGWDWIGLAPWQTMKMPQTVKS